MTKVTKVTSILDLLSEEKKDEEIKEYSSDTECFFDYENTLENRLKAFKNIQSSNKLQAQEIVSDLCSTFSFSPVETILETIKSLLKINDLEIPMRLVLCTCVYNVEEKRSCSYELFLYLIKEMMYNKDLYNSTIYLEILKYLVSTEYTDYHTIYEDIKQLCEFMVNYCSTDEYKTQIYKSIYSMLNESKYHKDILIYTMNVIKNTSNDRLRIIIISQFYNILNQTTFTEEILVDELLDIVNRNTDENTRADVADLLLRFSREESKTEGAKILSSIEGIKGKRNFYDNSQNIHHINVDENLQQFIQFLSTYQSLIVVKGTEEDLYQKSKNELLSINSDSKISQSLNRIYLDSTLYNGFSILTIYLKIWLIIQSDKNKDELLKRLIEELIDMSDTCSTGHILRLSNVFSGFGYTLKMDIQSEMRSKISHLVSTKLQQQNDEEQLDLIDNITSEEEMNIFSKFFMKNVEWIKTELLKDYKDIIDQDEFQELFRKELVFFETNGKN